MKKLFCLPISVVLILLCFQSDSFGQTAKPRVIAMTDGEVDDRSSMVRFLLYTNEIDLLAIIQTSSIFQRSGWSKDKWIEKQLDAYEQVHPNLIIHDPAYPTAAKLRSILYVGDEDSTHLPRNFSLRGGNSAVEGDLINPANWPDTPGSDKIVEILLENDPRPVHLQAWGGGNTAARAFYKIKTKYPKDYDRALSKVVMYHIWYQDAGGAYIEKYHPKVTMVLDNNFAGSWNYGSQRYTYQYIKDNVKNNHGPLGALYPQDYVSEGDSPAYLYSVANGLRSHENPTYGGWGGRFYNVYGNVYKDFDKASYTRWIEYANRDFEAKMDYCVATKFADANHKPVIKVIGSLDRTVKSGETVELEVEITDPDGQRPSASWWQFADADTFEGFVEPSFQQGQNFNQGGRGNPPPAGPVKSKISFVAPKVTSPSTIHMVLESSDRAQNGVPSLTSFARFIITVTPTK
jgi:hypothetical protein